MYMIAEVAINLAKASLVLVMGFIKSQSFCLVYIN